MDVSIKRHCRTTPETNPAPRRTRTRALVAAVCALCLCALPPVHANNQTEPNAPAPGAPAKPRPELEAMRQWFGELDDPDAHVREAARVKLMGMRRRDLDAFRALVDESRPLMPAQAAVLRHIVMHVYLAGEEYATTGTEGFLGVRMQETSVRLPAADGQDQFAPAVGVVIVERMPGFVGSRMLLDGDVILGVAERPDVRMLGVYEFQMVVKSITPGTTVHFQVLRQGQVQRVPVTLDPRPFDAEAFVLQNLIEHRQRRANSYWEESFGKLLNEIVG